MKSIMKISVRTSAFTHLFGEDLCPLSACVINSLFVFLLTADLDTAVQQDPHSYRVELEYSAVE